MNNCVFPAHIENGRIQTVAEHCRGTAERAAITLQRVGLSETAYLAGLIHDMGKCKAEFSDYIREATESNTKPVGVINHTFAAVRFILSQYHTTSLDYDDVSSEIIAYAAGAHHGLFDIIDLRNKNNGFLHRIEKNDIGYKESVDNYLTFVATKKELNERFQKASIELKNAMSIAVRLVEGIQGSTADEEIQFYIGLLARLILSAVVEGDRYDTARFMTEKERPTFNYSQIWSEALKNIEQQLNSLSKQGKINQARSKISEECFRFAVKPSGIYRLNVPTGGGKTLAALRYAIAHCKEKEKSRVFYISPLISILEQNAECIRKAIGCENWVLEHHSNVVQYKENQEELDRFELLTENWDSPIIVTTLVQFLNTLFSGKMSCVRRFQALTNSVLILDEVQTVPIKMLSLFNLAMNFLSHVCGASVILCSATQPCLELVPHALQICNEPLVVREDDWWRCFQRTKMIDLGPITLSDLPGRIILESEHVNSILIICNTKREARLICESIQRRGLKCFHLSAAMCMAHRRKVLTDLNSALTESKRGERKVICVASQVIEAGVDISFQTVFRLAAGMDNIIQSAGRCNRNGELVTKAPVYIVRCLDENLQKLKDISDGKAATLALLDEYCQNPERFDDDLSSDRAIDFYYRERFSKCKKREMDFYIKVKGIDGYIFDMLSDRKDYEENEYSTFLHQAFKTAGKYFCVLDNDNIDVLAPYEDGAKIINELEHDIQFNQTRVYSLLEKAKDYTISISLAQAQRLERQGLLYPIWERRVFVLNSICYDSTTGIKEYDGEAMEVYI